MQAIAAGISRNAAAKEPVYCCGPTARNGHSTNPNNHATDQENPFPTPRILVGYTSAVKIMLGPQKPRNPMLHSSP